MDIRALHKFNKRLKILYLIFIIIVDVFYQSPKISDITTCARISSLIMKIKHFLEYMLYKHLFDL